MKISCDCGATISNQAERLAYQCRECGRLFVDDREHQLHTFAPASTETSRELLRSRDGDHAA